MTDSVVLDPIRLHPDSAEVFALLRGSRVRVLIAAVVCLIVGVGGLATLLAFGQGPWVIIGVLVAAAAWVRDIQTLKNPRPPLVGHRVAQAVLLLTIFAATALAQSGHYWVLSAALGAVTACSVGYSIAIPIVRREAARNPAALADRGRLFEATLSFTRSEFH